ncbi:CoA-binding protein [Undibacterium sp. TJN25]|uniref:CoA-binding protein n=1 Tax=Undibacterium sp. TJN25 TaxID=3413056 RepID=UPI003BF13F2E
MPTPKFPSKMTSKEIASLLQSASTIAVVGLSPRPSRPSYDVAAYLQRQGYRIVPVNPVEEGATLLGEHCYASLDDAVRALRLQGRQIDIVDCFRRSEEIPAIVDEAIRLGLKCVWMQLGVIHAEAARKAEAAGMQVVMDKCIKIEHGSLNIPTKG